MAIDLDRSGVAVKLILPGAIDTEIWDQPDNDAPLYDGPKEPPEGIAEGHRRRHRQRPVRALPARHEGGHRDAKTSDFDSFMVGMRAMTGSQGAKGTVKALLFGAPPDPGSPARAPPTSWRRCWRGSRSACTTSTTPARPSGLGDHPADPLGHLRLRRQAGARRLQHGRHRQPDGGLLVAPPRAGARGGGRGGGAGTRGHAGSTSASAWSSIPG
jgi:hypothetical protein